MPIPLDAPGIGERGRDGLALKASQNRSKIRIRHTPGATTRLEQPRRVLLHPMAAWMVRANQFLIRLLYTVIRQTGLMAASWDDDD
jgi:hypothetical protein